MKNAFISLFSTAASGSKMPRKNAGILFLILALQLGAAPAVFGQWIESAASEMYYQEGNVGIGAGFTDPTRLLHLRVNSTSTTNGQFYIHQLGTGDAWMNIGLEGSRHFALGVDNTTGDDVFRISTSSASAAGLVSSQSTVLFNITPGGNVGIGAGFTSPTRLLHLRANSTSTTSGQFYIQQDGTGDAWMNIGLNGGRHYALGVDNATGDDLFKISTSSASAAGLVSSPSTVLFSMTPGGNVSIGTGNTTYKLNVNGTIRATEIRVETGWADYVFGDNYRLRPLSELEQYIREHRRLPGVTSAAEIQQDGLQVAKQMTEMMAKVEELTLYILELNKRLEQLEQENAALKSK